MPEKADTQEHPVDTLSSRLAQSEGILRAIDCAFDDDDAKYVMTPEAMRDALWGVTTLITQARSSLDAYCDQKRQKGST